MSDTAPSRPRVLLVDDEPANLEVLHRYLEGAGYAVLVATQGEHALRIAARSRPGLVLLDVQMPGLDGFEVCRRLKQDESTRNIPVIFVTARDQLSARLDAFRAGGVDYIHKPFEEAEVMARVRTHLALAQLQAELAEKNAELERRLTDLRAEIDRREHAEHARDRADARAADVVRREAERCGVPGFVGANPTIAGILDEVGALQEAERLDVLITGESGTGKELIARAIHAGGRRRDRPFVAVNCSAIPGELAESALFGHVKGAFSGATQDHRGYFEEADGGTLFLDEVGDMPLILQPKLLRVLEERRVRPVGSAGDRAVNVRVIAATNADPAAQLARGALRQDLYFRLARIPVHVPPLRARRDDVPLLARHFLALVARETGRPAPALGADALAALDAYGFPGNVRELKNMMEHAVLTSRGEPIRAEHLHFLTLPAAPAAAPPLDEIILAHVRTHGSIDCSTCRELLEVTPRRATYLLDGLTRAGRLVRQGTRRWTRYALPARE